MHTARTAFLCLFVLALAPAAALGQELRVVVFEDVDGDGRPGAGEAPLADLRVGHGLDRHLTDAEGAVALVAVPAAPRWVHVQLPDEWAHVGPHWRRDDEEGPLLFPARRRERVPRAFSFVHATDLHVGSRSHDPGLLRELVAGWGELQPPVAFALITGDLSEHGTPEELAEARAALAASPIPVWLAPGNHDLGKGPARGLAYHDIGPAFFGFDYGGLHFTVAYTAALDTPEFAWTLADIREAGRPTVLVMHHLPSARRLEGLRGLPLAAVLHGHWHGNRVAWFEGYPVIATSTALVAGWDHSPAGLRRVDVREREIVAAPLLGTGLPSRSFVSVPSLAHEDPVERLIVRALSSTRPPTRGRWTLVAPDTGAHLATGRLQRRGPHTWSAELPVLPLRHHDLRLSFEDGAGIVADGSVSVATPPARRDWQRPKGRWPTYRGDAARSGHAKARLRPPLALRWAVALPGSCQHAAPVASETTLFVALENREGFGASPALYALDRTTGDLRWAWPAASSLRASPVLVPGRPELVAVQEESGDVTALRAEDGEVVWRFPHSERFPARHVAHWAACAPLVVGRELIACYHARPVVLDARTGRLLQELEVQGREDAFTTAAASYRDGRLFLGGLFSGLSAYERASGRRWERRWRARSRRLSATPLPTREGLVSTDDRFLRVVDLVSGETRREERFRAAWSPSPPTALGERLVLVDRAGALVALRPGARRPDWRLPTGPAVEALGADTRPGQPGVSSAPVLSGGVLYVGADDGLLRAIDGRTGRLFWQRELGLPVTGGPIVAGEDLYAVDRGGVVWAFSPKERRRKGR